MKHGNGDWFKYYRSSTENEFYFTERFTKWQAWIDLLTLAAFAPRTVFIRGIEFNLQPGDMIESQKTLAKRWKWSNNTVIKFLTLLSSRGQISIKVHHRISAISIANWKKYQGSEEEREPQTAPQIQPQTAPAIRRDKKGKKEDMQPFFRCEFFSVSKGRALEYADAFQLSEEQLLFEFKRMNIWLEDNPKKRKKDYPKFVHNWLNRRNEHGKTAQPKEKRLPECKKETEQWLNG